ncbi:hypothetical protein IH992_32960, partial [Candidatus Poribacteria bacterium]|nr:hypothetical protein [Candidatus Poribacteria bacterium]
MSEPITARKNRFPYTFSPLPKDSHLVTRRLSPSGKDIYSYIVGRVDGKQKTGWTFKVSDRDIRDTFGYRRETISRARQEIQSLGLAIQLPHAHRQCRMFYIGTLEQVRWMHVALIVAFIKMAKRHSAMEAIKRLRARDAETALKSQNCEQTVTSLCADGHKTVSVSSQESPAENPPNPRPQRVSSDDSQTVQESLKECIQEYPPPISPSNIEMLSLAWNESHEYEEGEGEEFDKYFSKAIRATMAQHAVDENVATAALIRAFHRTKRNPAGHHPYDYPTAYTGDPDHSESNATPRGKKILRGAIHAVKSGESFSSHKQPSSESNDSMVEAPQIERQNPIHENMDSGDSEKGSAPPPKPNQAEPSRPDTPKTSLATVRRNLAGRAAMLKAGIISPLSRDEVLSHAQPGLDAFDDTPGDDVILGVWNELAPTPVEPKDTPPNPVEPTKQPKPDAFMELSEIQAKIVGLDEMRRSGTLSVDEVAEVTQEIADFKRKKVMLQRGRGNVRVERDSDKCSPSVAQDADKGVSDAFGYLETKKEGSTTEAFKHTPTKADLRRLQVAAKYPETDEQRLQWIGNRISTVSPDDKHVSATTGASEGSTTGDSLGRRIARTIKSSLMVDKDYSDEQIVTIVQRQERSIDSSAILEVWHNWSDWSAYMNDFVDQQIQSGSLMPDEVLEARSYAARLRDWERKND